MKLIEVTKACKVNGEPKSPGDSVEVDEATAANLVRKDWARVTAAKPTETNEAETAETGLSKGVEEDQESRPATVESVRQSRATK